MSLQPKIKVLAQDTELYASITLQDDTGVYNVTTNPGGYGTPNPGSGDVLKTLIREEYMGDTAPGSWEVINTVEVLGAGSVWTHSFREGVTKITYLVGTDIVGGGFTGLKGNLQFLLTNANTVLLGATFIEIDGIVYELDLSKGLSATGGWVKTAFSQDHIVAGGIQYFQGYVYTLWNTQGYKALIQEIGNVACTTLECGMTALDLLLVRYRFYLATGYNFTKKNYSKAHNLAVMLSPELTTTNCATC
jgi:hypothetical protein